MKKLFITGISTEVGKTIAAAIITEALEADYWKPVQAGDLDNSDSDKVSALISNPKTTIHPNSYALQVPMSPHAAAEKEGIEINLEKINPPKTSNHLVIEGAGGVLVPLNTKDTIMDIIRPDYKTIIVSRHYLGSINHTLLTIEALKSRGLTIGGIIFNGCTHDSYQHKTTEEIIIKMTGVPVIGKIYEEPQFDKETIRRYATLLKPTLETL
ncbi:dethiobiotin synthase [Leptobacterium sp. I13]|uniref:dethiobiotin synthase n=1 Tax=Leptobacterium meishanense TaxID=3128904 RepID=UPI0030EEE2F6